MDRTRVTGIIRIAGNCMFTSGLEAMRLTALFGSYGLCILSLLESSGFFSYEGSEWPVGDEAGFVEVLKGWYQDN